MANMNQKQPKIIDFPVPAGPTKIPLKCLFLKNVFKAFVSIFCLSGNNLYALCSNILRVIFRHNIENTLNCGISRPCILHISSIVGNLSSYKSGSMTGEKIAKAKAAAAKATAKAKPKAAAERNDADNRTHGGRRRYSRRRRRRKKKSRKRRR